MVAPLYNKLYKLSKEETQTTKKEKNTEEKKTLLFQKLKITSESHSGLFFDKFFDQYDDSWKILKADKKKKEDKDGKAKFLENFREKCGDDKLLTNHCSRLTSLASTLKAECKVFKTTWHFVTGMGLQHPVENGFAWHPTLGVPYLAGSGVKGLLRAWVETWAELEEKERLEVRRTWFGEQKGYKQRKIDAGEYSPDECDSVGQLIFFDAIPIEPVKLTVDIMTPHYGKWYEQGNGITSLNESEKIPADWHNPEPHHFLVVKNASFLFVIAARKPEFQDQIKEAMSELEKALKYIGAGAKTAVGYGQFNLNLAMNKEIEKKEIMASTPLEDRLHKEVESFDIEKLSTMLSKNKKKTFEEWGEKKEQYLKIICEIHGQKIKENWENSHKDNEKKAFKLLYPK